MDLYGTAANVHKRKRLESAKVKELASPST